MRRCVLFFAATGAVLLAAACESSPEEAAPIVTGGGRAPAEAAAERDCFAVNAVTGFRIVDEDTVLLNVGASTSYEVDAGGATCTSLRFANQIALDTGGAPSSFVCTGDGPQTASIRTDQGDECLIEAVRRAPEPAPDGAGTAAPAGG